MSDEAPFHVDKLGNTTGAVVWHSELDRPGNYEAIIRNEREARHKAVAQAQTRENEIWDRLKKCREENELLADRQRLWNAWYWVFGCITGAGGTTLLHAIGNW